MWQRRLFEVLEIGGVSDRTARLVEWTIILMVVVNVTAAVLATVPSLAATHGTLFVGIEAGTVFFFALEYGLRLWVAPLQPALVRQPPWRARLAFLRQPLAVVDLLAILPPVIGVLFGLEDAGIAVAFRLLRFLKLARYSPGIRSLAAAIASERRAILASGVIMMGLIVAVASLMHALEGDLQPTVFGSIPAAMYWAVTTLTTVGYGDAVPISPAGKVLAGITMVLGFTMFALPVGVIATAFAREIRQREFIVTWSMISRVPLFSELDAAEVADVLRLLRAQSVGAGTVITYAGEPATSMYFIVAGQVEIQLPGKAVVMGEGKFFGEIAVLSRARRSADVVALAPTRLLVLDADDFHHLMHRRPKIARHVRAVARERLQGEAVTPKGDISAAEIAGSPDPDTDPPA